MPQFTRRLRPGLIIRLKNIKYYLGLRMNHTDRHQTPEAQQTVRLITAGVTGNHVIFCTHCV